MTADTSPQRRPCEPPNRYLEMFNRIKVVRRLPDDRFSGSTILPWLAGMLPTTPRHQVSESETPVNGGRL